MRNWVSRLAAIAVLALPAALSASNPIVTGWYADPEIRIFAGEYWIYPTTSDDEGAPDFAPNLTPEQRDARKRGSIRPEYMRQTFLDAFSSRDLIHWTKHRQVLTIEAVSWAAFAVWAPSAIAANGRYYLFFGANDIQNDHQLGGIGVAVSNNPAGPFRDAIGKPLVGAFHNGAQPIDQFVFRDDGQYYLFYGGWGHCNVARLSPDLTSLVPFPDGSSYKEITPPGYVEGSFMVKRKGVYYLMWSEGGWTGPDYRVAYATGPSVTGPFKPMGTILAQDLKVARGAGHHSVVNVPGTDDWYIVYHRRPLGDENGGHRMLAIDRMYFNPDGSIRPVKITDSGVTAPRLLPRAARRQ